MKTMRLAALVAAGLLAGSYAAAQAKDYNITIHTGAQGGMYMETMVVWADLWKEKYANVKVTPILGGNVPNILKLRDAQGNEAVAVGDTYVSVIGYEGTEDFAQRAPGGVKNLRSLFRYNVPSYGKILVRGSKLPAGVNTFGELLAKKPALKWVFHNRGNIGEVQARVLLESYGLKFEDLQKWGGSVTFISHETMAQQMIDGQADIAMAATRQPAAWMLDMDNSIRDLTWLPIEGKNLDDIAVRSKGGFFRVVEPAEAYKSMKGKPYQSFANDHIVLVNEKMDDELAYMLVKAVLQNPDRIRNAVSALKPFDPKVACSNLGNWQIYPGAARACKEAGAMM